MAQSRRFSSNAASNDHASIRHSSWPSRPAALHQQPDPSRIGIALRRSGGRGATSTRRPHLSQGCPTASQTQSLRSKTRGPSSERRSARGSRVGWKVDETNTPARGGGCGGEAEAPPPRRLPGQCRLAAAALAIPAVDREPRSLDRVEVVDGMETDRALPQLSNHPLLGPEVVRPKARWRE